MSLKDLVSRGSSEREEAALAAVSPTDTGFSRFSPDHSLCSPLEEPFARLAAIVARSLDAPMAAIVWLATDGSRHRAAYGVSEELVDDDIVGRFLHEAALICLSDARKDSRLRGHPLVQGPRGVRFIAGLPLVSPGGRGVVLVFDPAERAPLGARDCAALGQFGALVSECIGALPAVRFEPDSAATEVAARADLAGTAVDALSDLIFYLDLNGQVVWSNAAFQAFFSPVPETGARFSELADGSDPETFSEQLGLALTTGQARLSVEIVDTAGCVRSFDFILHGRGNGVLCVGRDQTDRKRFETCLSDLRNIAMRQSVGLVKKIEDMLDLCRRHLQMESGFVAGLDQDRCTIMFTASELDGFRPGQTCLLEQSYCSYPIELGHVYCFENGLLTFPDEVRANKTPRCGSFIGAPVYADGRLYGVVGFCSEAARDEAFVHRDARLVDLLAGIVGYEISRNSYISELTQANQRLQRLVKKDPLTDTLCRREFFRSGHLELSRAKRHNRPLAMVVLDVDQFGAINAQYGHFVGDVVLVETAKLIRTELRGSDLLGRLGGEEFGLVLPEVSEAGGMTLAERVLALFQAVPIKAHGVEVPVSVSIGLCEMNAYDSTLDDMLRRAYQALERAKQAGGNTVCTD